MLFNKNNIKNYITALAVSLFVAILAAPTASHAQTVTCTGVGTETITTDSRVFFDYSANTCAVSDGTALGPDTGDSVFRAQVAGSEVFTVNLSGSGNTNVGHSGATIGTFTAAAGVASANNRTTNGAETASVTYSGPSSETIVMNVAYTIAGGGNSIDITSASVTITAAASSAATAQPKSLQASVSRSQLIVIGKNIGSRISSGLARGRCQRYRPRCARRYRPRCARRYRPRCARWRRQNHARWRHRTARHAVEPREDLPVQTCRNR